MTASFDPNIDVVVTTDAPAVTRRGFGTPIIVDAAGMSERVLYFETLAAAQAAQVAGDITSAQLTHITSAFGQAQRPQRIGAGRGSFSDVAQVNTITVGGVAATGNYTITINGVAFTFAATVPADDNDAIAAGLRSAINGGSEPVTASGAGAAVIVTADVAGDPFDVGALVAPTGASLTNVATTANQSIATELAAILAESGEWYGFGIISRADKDVLRAAAWCESNNRLFVAQSSTAAILTSSTSDVFSELQDASYNRTIPFYYATDASPAGFAWMSFVLATPLDSRTTLWAYKTLTGITPSSLTDTQKGNLLAKNGNAYLTLQGVGATGDGKLASGRFIDVITSVDWLSARVKEALAQLVLNYSNRNSKIPYDDTGFALIADVILRVLEQGIAAGHFTRQSDGSSPYVRYTERAQVPLVDVQARLFRVDFGALLSGAVQLVAALGYVTDDIDSLALVAGITE